MRRSFVHNVLRTLGATFVDAWDVDSSGCEGAGGGDVSLHWASVGVGDGIAGGEGGEEHGSCDGDGGELHFVSLS